MLTSHHPKLITIRPFSPYPQTSTAHICRAQNAKIGRAASSAPSTRQPMTKQNSEGVSDCGSTAPSAPHWQLQQRSGDQQPQSRVGWHWIGSILQSRDPTTPHGTPGGCFHHRQHKPTTLQDLAGELTVHSAKEDLRRCRSGRHLRAIAATVHLNNSKNRDDVKMSCLAQNKT